jgi:hypothetical protein
MWALEQPWAPPAGRRCADTPAALLALLAGAVLAGAALVAGGGLPPAALAVLGVAAGHGALLATALAWAERGRAGPGLVAIALLAVAALAARHPAGALAYAGPPLWIAWLARRGRLRALGLGAPLPRPGSRAPCRPVPRRAPAGVGVARARRGVGVPPPRSASPTTPAPTCRRRVFLPRRALRPRAAPLAIRRRRRFDRGERVATSWIRSCQAGRADVRRRSISRCRPWNSWPEMVGELLPSGVALCFFAAYLLLGPDDRARAGARGGPRLALGGGPAALLRHATSRWSSPARSVGAPGGVLTAVAAIL